ncbi:hypothetical protein BGZ57DRAFT_975557 [Hyaloscypha finlandica]|nr:hypothetical protein BGZ57DRAFT_975557 [Hyaloscypha finlandica]
MASGRPEIAGAASKATIYTVSGTVYNPNDTLAPNLTVKAFDRDLRRECALGQATTTVEGVYSIRYTSERFGRAEKGTADLCFRVVDSKGCELYVTPFDDTIFNAPINCVFDIHLQSGDTTITSDFQRILDAIKPLFVGSGLESPVSLSEDDKNRDISFISRETGLDASGVENVAIAYRLTLLVKAVPLVFFYALLAQKTLLQANTSTSSGLPVMTIDLSTPLQPILYDAVLLPEETIQNAVKAAVNTHQVSKDILDKLPSILKILSTKKGEATKYKDTQASVAPRAQLESFFSTGKAEKILDTLSTNAHGDLLGSMKKLQDALLTLPSDSRAVDSRASRTDDMPKEEKASEKVTKSPVTPLKPTDDLIRKVMGVFDLSDESGLLTLSSDELEKALNQISHGSENEVAAHFPIDSFVTALEQKHPTTAFAAAMRRDISGFSTHRDDILGLLESQEGINLATVNINTMLQSAQSTALSESSAEKGDTTTRHTLSAMQRLFRVSPNYHHVKSLMSANVLSASKIHSMGKSRLSMLLESDPSLTGVDVESVYQRATNISHATSLRAGELAAITSATRLAALAPADFSLSSLVDDFPTLKSLFQIGDFCACSECRTVHSAAAYVADTLHYLDERLVVDKHPVPGQLPISAKKVLFARRPDLGDMDLSCDNTNIPLPYIDVVCELLEEAVYPDPGTSYNGSISTGLVSPALLSALNAARLPFSSKATVSQANTLKPFSRIVRDKQVVAKLLPTGSNAWQIIELKQTYGPAEQVKAVTQYVNAKAYGLLEDAEYALGLPFSLPHQECKAYFAQFNVSRSQLMQALQTAGSGPTDTDIAAELLGLTEKEYGLISKPQPLKQDTFWDIGDGLPAIKSMSIVENFVIKSGLGYSDLQLLLTLQWLNPSGTMFIKHLDNTCTLAQKIIVNLGNDDLDRLHRFIRLMRKTSISSSILDRLLGIKSFQPKTLGGDFLKILSQLSQLHSLYNIPWDVISYIFDMLPTDGGISSPYNRIFMNQTANGKVEEAFDPANLTANESADPSTAKKLADFDTYLALCLGTSLPEMQSLLLILGPPTVLSLKSLSIVYAFVQLARAARLSPSDLQICQPISGIDILSSPANTLQFLDVVKIIRGSKINPKDFKYYLFHTADDLQRRELSVDTINSFLDALVKGYAAAAVTTRSPFVTKATADENQGPVVDFLSKVPSLSPSDIATYKSILVGYPWSDASKTAAEFIDSTLGGVVASVTNIKVAQASLSTAPSDNNEAERKLLLNLLANELSANFYQLAKSDFLLDTAKSTFKLGDDNAPILLKFAKLKTAHASAPTFLMEILTADFSPPSPPTDSDQSRALRLLYKMNNFIGTLSIPADRVKWMLTNNEKLGWMELDHLKYQDDSALPVVKFETWSALQDAIYLIQSFPDVTNEEEPASPFSTYTLFDIVLSGSASQKSILHYFASLTGLDENVMTDLAVLFNYSISAYKNAATFRQLERCTTILRTLGLSVANGKTLLKSTLDLQDASLMRQALKARYSDDDWLGVLKSIQDPLRRQKRDALVNYLLSVNKDFKTADDLYDYYLIDTQMGSCMDTSRVVQAHATIQLFVQRCLLGLEIHSVASEDVDPRWSEWRKWMANYRVWELNKKVFLFPHQFLDPGVRKDKSELFLDFESGLQQDQLTDSALEACFATYLEQLDGIAHVDVMACYYETAKTTMHVFARNKGGDPAKFFHRTFPQERSWTPWETINVDITGDILLAFERNSRITLAWPVFSEEPDPAQTSRGPNIPDSSTIHDPGKPTDKVKKRWKIQLAVSKFVDGKWSAKTVSRDAMYYPVYGYMDLDSLKSNYSEETFIFFSYQGTNLGQAIACYSNDGWLGAFALTGCSGLPEVSQASYDGQLVGLPFFEDTDVKSGRYVKRDDPEIKDLGMLWLFNITGYEQILDTAALKFTVTYPFQLDLVDTLASIWALYFSSANANRHGEYSQSRRGLFYQFGTFMPYFYGDSERTYTVIPGRYSKPIKRPRGRGPAIRKTYADIFTVVNDGYNLAVEFIKAFRQDPTKNVQKLLQELADDQRYKNWLKLYQELFAKELTYSSRFRNFYHPLVCALRTALNGGGVRGLMDRSLQVKQNDFNFVSTYGPTSSVYPDYPVEDLDFSVEGAYADYNWELFFHTIYEVALKLNQDQRFDQAQSWLHHIFNPLGAGKDSAPKRYWVTKPFQLMTTAGYVQQRIDTILGRIAQDVDHPDDDLKAAVLGWRADPFDPWMVAKTRTVEYQIAVVLAYVKNLCDWGDSLFRQFTREAITQATQLYVLAHKLLGPKPRLVAPAVETPIRSYNELEAGIDLTGNALMDLENLVPNLDDLPHGGAELPPLGYTSLYFCIPPDDNMLSYWALVDDRLTKIRTCRNIDGVEASLSLFAPPIDFGALSRALASGMDISAFLSGLNSPLPNYKFHVMASKASELASHASSLGSLLLQALEKRDFEALARLKSTEQVALLKAIRDTKVAAITEAKNAYDGLALVKAVTQAKYDWYSTQELMNAWEITATSLSGASLLLQAMIAVGYALSGGLKLIPNFMAGGAGFGGSPTVNVTMGGSTIGNGAEMAVATIGAIASGLDKASGMASAQAGYRRRKDDWDFQASIAHLELASIDGQITTAKSHWDTAVSDLTAHDVSASNADEEDAFLHSKYTTKELYDWMVRQISGVYLAAYKLAFDMGKKAERCYQLELARDDVFLSYGFDTLKKGLLAAESLQSSIHLLQTSYLDNHNREFEITKHVSLRMIDPRALISFKTTGKCVFQVPEAWFDLDYPGHYMRRHKTVSLTIPCVIGPYTSISCKLTQVANRYRRDPGLLVSAATPQEAYDESSPGGDQRFMYNVGRIQSIATSTCQQDSGLFQVSFEDERYLPFESTGVIATWQLELPSAFPQFDYDTITDVILHLQYTARDGGSTLASAVKDIQMDELNGIIHDAKFKGLFQAYSVKQRFPMVWNQIMLSADHLGKVIIDKDALPFFARNHGPTIDSITFFAALDTTAVSPLPTQLKINVAGETTSTVLNPDPTPNTKGNYIGKSSAVVAVGTEFSLQLVGMSLGLVKALKDVVVLIHYVLTE